MTFLTAVCDDLPEHATQTAARLGAFCPPPHSLKSECFFRAEALLDAIRCDGYLPQLAVLDIDMPGMDGITLAKTVAELLPECRIIFLSAYLDYASAVYTTEHVWFLYKPTAERYLADAIRKAIQGLLPGSGDSLLLSSRGIARSLATDLILLLERRLHSTIVHTDEEEITVTAHPDELLRDVPAGRFCRCHKSFWVAFPAVRELNGNAFILRNGQPVPISRSHREARQQYFDYLDTLVRTHRLRD